MLEFSPQLCSRIPTQRNMVENHASVGANPSESTNFWGIDCNRSEAALQAAREGAIPSSPTILSPCGWNSRHAALRTQCRKACGCDSCHGHHFMIYIGKEIPKALLKIGFEEKSCMNIDRGTKIFRLESRPPTPKARGRRLKPCSVSVQDRGRIPLRRP